MTWANQVRILKENFQALGIVVGQGLIQAFKPALIWINNALVAVTEFAESVVNALGKIFGWQIDISAGSVDYGDVADGIGDIGDAADGAGKSVKDLKGQLQGFDKLNVLTTPSNGSGGGGGGGGGASGGGGGSSDVGFSVKDTVGLFESEIDNLEDLGKYISQRLGDAVANIDWDSIFEKARNFGKGLADFLNGLFATREDGGNVFSDVTKTIANALNAVVYAACEFAVNFDWIEFGKNLATSINDFFKTFDWQKAGFTVHSFVQGIKDALVSFLTTLTWKDIFTGVGTFLGELTAEDYALIFAAWTTFKVASWVTSGGFVATLTAGIGKAFTDAGGWTGIITGALSGTTEATTIGGGVVSAVGGGFAIAAIPLALTFIVKTAFELTYEKHKDEEGVEEIYQAALGDMGVVKKNKDGTYTVDTSVTASGYIHFEWLLYPFKTLWEFAESKGKEVFGNSPVTKNEDGTYSVNTDMYINWGVVVDWVLKPFKKLKEWWQESFNKSSETGFITQNADGTYTVNEDMYINWGVVVEWVKKGAKTLKEFLFGDGSSEDENGNGEVTVTANVEAKKTGLLEKAGSLLKWLTGRDDGTTVSENKVKLGKSAGWKDKTYKQAITGTKSGNTSGTFYTRLGKSKGWQNRGYKEVITGSKSGNTSGTFVTYVKPNYGGYSSFAQLVYNGKNGLDVHAKMIIDKLEAGKGVHIDGTSGRAYINLATGGMLIGHDWKPIAQYASGTLSAAQGELFVAREAGPELVGSIGGHSAVMNNDQIVSSVAYGVESGVRGAMAEQNAILRSQNNILTQILAKEYGITQSDVFNAVRSENVKYINRTGRSAFSY